MRKPLAEREFVDTIKEVITSKKSLFILTLIVITVSVLTIWNMTALQSAIDRRTEIYVEDVTIQLANDIDNRLNKNILDLEMLRDSLLHINDYEDAETLTSFLDRKSGILGFTAIALVEQDGSIHCAQPVDDNIFDMPGIRDSFQGESGVSFLNHQRILYSIPIYRGEKVVGVLAGVHDKENMQKLIQPKSFSGKGLTCITDQEGSVIISPTDLNAFLQLDSIFLEENNKTVQRIEQMKKDMKEQKSGVFPFTAVDGSDLVLSYNPLNSYDWVLLTLVPADIISYETDSYVNQSYVIVAGIIFLFLIVLVFNFSTYRIHYKQLECVAFVDQVTEGMNNAAFQIHCRKLLQESPPNTYTVVLLNLKNFKLINENFGSQEGDRTLRYVMKVIQKHIREGELAARAEADHFFLCLKERDPEKIRCRLAMMVRDINDFSADTKKTSYFTIQQGAYTVDDPILEITVIQDRAKTASRTRSANQEGQCIFYDTAFTKQLQAEHELNDLFKDSIINGDFQVYFQPKVWLDSGKIGGAEALIRWHHPQRGIIYPSDFIPLFERNGKICRLDLYVFEEVCKMLARWIREGKMLFPISVNLSRQHFNISEFLRPFKRIADRYAVPTGLIELEMTESVFFDDQRIELVKQHIDEMHRLGFRCSLDDFGMGYSSLGLLAEFNVDAIKLDRRFFLHVDHTRSKAVVKSVINLAEQIGSHVVAEGIETEEQIEFLKSVGCRMVQGYYYSKPLPMADFERKWNPKKEV